MNQTFREHCVALAAETGFNFTANSDPSYCPSMWDGFTCWDAAVPNSQVFSPCPDAKGSDPTKSSFRLCGANGMWLDRYGVPNEVGWTNYTPCFTIEMIDLIRRLDSGSELEIQEKLDIARRTRILELVGNSLSLLAILFSLIIFQYFRCLKNTRTRLHRHLFVAVLIQVTIRLTLYIDQAIVRFSSQNTDGSREKVQLQGIDNTPVLCEAAYICLEYARSAMLMWMFVEGFYLHTMITVTVFEEKFSSRAYVLVGWGIPIPMTIIWAIATGFHYEWKATCWWGYNLTGLFWILEGPRLIALLVNLIFLLNIIRVLVTKLRQSSSSEIQQARKAVKAALFLLPLLGLTNLLTMVHAPLEKSTLEFALWSYTTHFLTSTQGFVLAVLYCFRNGEVQAALKKFVQTRILTTKINTRESPRSTHFHGHHVSPSIKVDSSENNGTENHVIKLTNRKLEMESNDIESSEDNHTIVKGLLSTCDILMNNHTLEDNNEESLSNELSSPSPAITRLNNNYELKEIIHSSSPSLHECEDETLNDKNALEKNTVKSHTDKPKFISLEILKNYCSGVEQNTSFNNESYKTRVVTL